MKIKSFGGAGIALVLSLILSPLAASAAFIATEDFDSYVSIPNGSIGQYPGAGTNWTSD
jgi:hypothetical protein